MVAYYMNERSDIAITRTCLLILFAASPWYILPTVLKRGPPEIS